MVADITVATPRTAVDGAQLDGRADFSRWSASSNRRCSHAAASPCSASSRAGAIPRGNVAAARQLAGTASAAVSAAARAAHGRCAAATLAAATGPRTRPWQQPAAAQSASGSSHVAAARGSCDFGAARSDAAQAGAALCAQAGAALRCLREAGSAAWPGRLRRAAAHLLQPRALAQTAGRAVSASVDYTQNFSDLQMHSRRVVGTTTDAPKYQLLPDVY